jgi:hypothetical protein
VSFADISVGKQCHLANFIHLRLSVLKKVAVSAIQCGVINCSKRRKKQSYKKTGVIKETKLAGVHS